METTCQEQQVGDGHAYVTRGHILYKQYKPEGFPWFHLVFVILSIISLITMWSKMDIKENSASLSIQTVFTLLFGGWWAYRYMQYKKHLGLLKKFT